MEIEKEQENIQKEKCPGNYEAFTGGWFIECKLCGRRPIEHEQE